MTSRRKHFFDILKSNRGQCKFEFLEEKLIAIAKNIKIIVDDNSRYTDKNEREDIKAELKVDTIFTLAKHKYPPVTKD